MTVQQFLYCAITAMNCGIYLYAVYLGHFFYCWTVKLTGNEGDRLKAGRSEPGQHTGRLLLYCYDPVLTV